ncbi:putative phage abortive infection protein [Chryseobacterium polytrichastri]|uniref:Putative phage abortive infection protein n=1 Tax=Chryseobacterium polytrichastri TaxID=1302687 RepID=A0A1M6ZSJ0_9FLAO|nr:putative phage abortive infection protein [Chryseobacterium polytrichastri]SHL33447.1 Putative phage abortive infection protein [Chryseobacterium polytrichastri]
MKRTILFFSWSIIGLGLLIIIMFLIKSNLDGFSISFNDTTNFEKTGQFGDYVGGVIGTFFTLAGTLLLILTLKEQQDENKRNAFESYFFEMIRLHKENVSEFKYIKHKNGEASIFENRQVIRKIFEEFIECYREVRKFSNSDIEKDYISDKYLIILKKIIKSNDLIISPIELARIDIAYSVVFFGLGTEGEGIIKKIIRKRYRPEYYYKLLFYLKLKPKKSNKTRYKLWEKLRNLPLKDLMVIITELYNNKNTPEKTEGLSELSSDFKMHLIYEKYYGGHQFRLGHYFRHLFQSYKFLNENLYLKDIQKYNYGKMLRAQLSTYEQAIILINSITPLGMKWEYLAEKEQNKLITKYQIIKNLHGEQIFGIRYKMYYPNIKFESEETLL